MTRIKFTENTISYKQILTIAISILVGIGISIVSFNLFGEEVISFSTIDFITFITSILFACASVVLAITAINLSKSSEDIMVKRSDESIRLQNETFQKTIEVLNRIESSTGVTEKRIEDMISGRVSTIASSLLENELIGSKDKKLIEDQIRKSVRSESKETTPEEKEKERKRREELKKLNHEYKVFQNDITVAVSNDAELNKVKIGDGTFRGTGEELIDIIVEFNSQNVGCSVFYENLHDKRSLQRYLEEIFKMIDDKTVSKFIMIFNIEGELYKVCNEYIMNKSKLMKPEITNNIIISVLNKDMVSQKIKEYAA